MAYIGLARPVIAVYHQTGGKASYSGGIRFGRAINVEISPQYEDVSEYGDINDTDEKQAFSYADISLNIDEIPEEAEPVMFGHNASAGGIVYGEDDCSGFVGLGVRVRKIKSGQIKYIGIWLHKAIFTEDAQTYDSKDESMKYGTPTVKGKAVPDIEGNWKTKKIFDTAKEADSWIDELAGIEREE